jgi:hypothetical protein
MKKLMALVFAGLMMLVVSGALFALGSKDESIQGGGIARAEVIDQVPTDQKFLPARNPKTTTAEWRPDEGGVHALPATKLDIWEEALPPPFYAISGVKNQPIREEGSAIEAVDIRIDLPKGEKFSRGLLGGDDVSSWIENLPAGLEARAHRVRKGATYILIYISGVPTVTAREVIRVTVPSTYLTKGAALQFVSPTEEENHTTWVDRQTKEDE